MDIAVDVHETPQVELTEEEIMAIQSFIRILESHTPGEIENAINHLK